MGQTSLCFQFFKFVRNNSHFFPIAFSYLAGLIQNFTSSVVQYHPEVTPISLIIGEVREQHEPVYWGVIIVAAAAGLANIVGVRFAEKRHAEMQTGSQHAPNGDAAEDVTGRVGVHDNEDGDSFPVLSWPGVCFHSPTVAATSAIAMSVFLTLTCPPFADEREEMMWPIHYSAVLPWVVAMLWMEFIKTDARIPRCCGWKCMLCCGLTQRMTTCAIMIRLFAYGLTSGLYLMVARNRIVEQNHPFTLSRELVAFIEFVIVAPYLLIHIVGYQLCIPALTKLSCSNVRETLDDEDHLGTLSEMESGVAAAPAITADAE